MYELPKRIKPKNQKIPKKKMKKEKKKTHALFIVKTLR
jgi:hypothetical protein